MFNASATLNALRLLYSPSLCLPHATVASFDAVELPFRIGGAQIRGVVLDKDNCIARDRDDKVWPPYAATWQRLLATYAPQDLLIVSNLAGTDDDAHHAEAAKLERDTGVTVLRHPTKKPGCHHEILAYFAQRGIRSSEIVVVGDRLFTDMLMANMMGLWGLWVRDGVEQLQKWLPRLERHLYAHLTSGPNACAPPTPQ
jgi:phosphatidylglycerophosphatase GEP4